MTELKKKGKLIIINTRPIYFPLAASSRQTGDALNPFKWPYSIIHYLLLLLLILKGGIECWVGLGQHEKYGIWSRDLSRRRYWGGFRQQRSPSNKYAYRVSNSLRDTLHNEPSTVLDIFCCAVAYRKGRAVLLAGTAWRKEKRRRKRLEGPGIWR